MALGGSNTEICINKEMGKCLFGEAKCVLYRDFHCILINLSRSKSQLCGEGTG